MSNKNEATRKDVEDFINFLKAYDELMDMIASSSFDFGFHEMEAHAVAAKSHNEKLLEISEKNIHEFDKESILKLVKK